MRKQKQRRSKKHKKEEIINGKILKFIKKIMGWNINFCQPAIPNDPMMNFHRTVQAGVLVSLLVFSSLIKAYYKIKGPDSQIESNTQSSDIEGEQDSINNKKKNGLQNTIRKDSQSQKEPGLQNESREDSQEHSQDVDNKEVSINLENNSYISFKSSAVKTWRPKKDHDRKTVTEVITQFTFEEIDEYFPIVFGHFAICTIASIMYSPFAEQTIATILYFLLSIVLTIVNKYRFKKITFLVWTIMAILNIFLFTSALLEIGQAAYDFVSKRCFSQGYVGLY